MYSGVFFATKSKVREKLEPTKVTVKKGICRIFAAQLHSALKTKERTEEASSQRCQFFSSEADHASCVDAKACKE